VRACLLEREEGIAARRLPDPDQQRPRKRHVEADSEQLVRGAEAQAADRHRLQAFFWHGAAQPRRRLTADREQHGYGLAFEASKREANDRERRGVQPLEVVDRDAEWTATGDESHRAEKGGGDCPVVGP
jgi:hypothetical protein